MEGPDGSAEAKWHGVETRGRRLVETTSTPVDPLLRCALSSCEHWLPMAKSNDEAPWLVLACRAMNMAAMKPLRESAMS